MAGKTENTPITDAELAEVKRLWERRKESEVDQLKWRQSSGICFPAILARLEAAEREREELREELAYIKQQLEWVEENGDTYQKSALMDFIRRTIHGISHTAAMKEALAARDAQQRREGAAAENDYWADEHEGLLGGHVSAAHVVRAFNLREGGE